MSAEHKFRIFWPLGLVLFIIAVILGLPLTITDVPMGMLAHQSAGSAEAVNAIHSAWSDAGVLGSAKAAMIADLLFIGVYSYGSFQGARALALRSQGGLRLLAMIVGAAAIVFCLTDYGETIAQFIQLMRGEGADQLARFAALCQPIKVVAFLVTFIGIIAGLIWERIVRQYRA